MEELIQEYLESRSLLKRRLKAGETGYREEHKELTQLLVSKKLKWPKWLSIFIDQYSKADDEVARFEHLLLLNQSLNALLCDRLEPEARKAVQQIEADPDFLFIHSRIKKLIQLEHEHEFDKDQLRSMCDGLDLALHMMDSYALGKGKKSLLRSIDPEAYKDVEDRLHVLRNKHSYSTTYHTEWIEKLAATVDIAQEVADRLSKQDPRQENVVELIPTLGHYPAKQRQALELIASGYSFQEAADYMGVSKGTVCRHVLNARDKAISSDQKLLQLGFNL